MKAAIVSASVLVLFSFVHVSAQAQQPAAPAPAAQPAPPAMAPIALPPELDRVLRDYERYWRGRDMPALAALFLEDGFVPSRQGWVRGRAGIQSRYAGMAGGALKLQAYAFGTDGTVGYIVGGYGYGEGAFTGKFVLALKRIGNGPWLIAADIDQ